MIFHVHGLEVGRSENPNPQLVALEKKGAEVADLIITVSEAMKQELVSLGVRAGEDSRMLPRRGRRVFQSPSG